MVAQVQHSQSCVQLHALVPPVRVMESARTLRAICALRAPRERAQARAAWRPGAVWAPPCARRGRASRAHCACAAAHVVPRIPVGNERVQAREPVQQRPLAHENSFLDLRSRAQARARACARARRGRTSRALGVRTARWREARCGPTRALRITHGTALARRRPPAQPCSASLRLLERCEAALRGADHVAAQQPCAQPTHPRVALQLGLRAQRVVALDCGAEDVAEQADHDARR